MQREFASTEILESRSLSRVLRGAGIIFSGLSAAWIVLLVTLVFRCRAGVHPYPILAKFAPYKFHYHFTESMLRASPVFAGVAILLLLGAKRFSRYDDSNRPACMVLGSCLLAEILVAAGNPAGWFSWLLS